MARIKTVEITVNGRRKIVNADDPRAAGGARDETGIPSKSDIATMKKGDVIEWLEAHGVTGASGTVSELRDRLRRTMFVDAD